MKLKEQKKLGMLYFVLGAVLAIAGYFITLAFVPLPRTHSQPARKAAHSGDTRLTARCRRLAHPQGR